MADVQVQPFVTPVVGGDYKNLSASGLVKTGDGHLLGIAVASSSGATIKVWDNTSAATTVLVNTMEVVGGGWYPMPFHFKTGCYLTITGTADMTVSFV